MAEVAREITAEDRLAVSTTVAAIVHMAEEIDTDVLDEMIAGQEHYHAIEPMLDPTRYRAEHKGMDASWAVLRSMRSFIQTVREVKNKEGKGNG